MGIMDTLFGGAKPNPAPAPAPQGQQQTAPQGQQQQVANPHVANNPLVPNGTNTPPATQPPEGGPASSPLDQFKDLWQSTTTTNPQSDPNAPLIQLNQQQLAEQVGKMDFTSKIPPELFQQVAAGGEDAIKALSKIVNVASQQAVAHALVGSSVVADGAIRKHGSMLRQEIPNFVKQQSVMDARRQANPALSNPAFEPMVAAVEQQMRTKFPGATASEISAQVDMYFNQFAESFAAPQTAREQQQQQQAAPKDTDWDEYAGGTGYDISKF